MRAPLLLALLTVLPGCLGPAGEPLEEHTSLAAPAVPVPPDNRTGGFAAFRESPHTDAYGKHRHDGWGGRAQVTVMAGRAEMGTRPGAEGVAAVARPSGGELVFEGTARIEVLLTDPQRRVCHPAGRLDGEAVCIPAPGDPLPSEGLRLEFLHASSGPADWLEAGPVAWGQPSSIAVRNATWTDMPHAAGSMWAFRIRSPHAHDAGLAFNLTVTAHRGEGAIPAWPAHPVFYTGDRPHRTVLSGSASFREGPGGAEREGATVPDRLVSAGTRVLLVFVNVTKLGGTGPTHWYLQFHNASGPAWMLTDPYDPEATTDRTTLVWRLAVDDAAMDSPYAPGSRWELFLRGATTTPAISCVSACGPPWSVEYDITVVATSALPPCRAEDEYGRCTEYATSRVVRGGPR